MPHVFQHPIEVRFRDCDPLGHVNNAVYATYFEVARFSYWREALGYTRADGFSFIMARVEVNFRAEAVAGEALDVRIRIGRIGRRSFTFDYEIVRIGDGVLIADGSSVQVMFDYATRKSQPVPEAYRARVAAFEQREFPVPAA
jgi:acyl-CoA thioester hydrolase